MGFKHAHFSGPSKIYHASQLSLGWMNDIISSLIVFPRALGHPPGGFLREDSGYGDEECQFFPISELQAESVPLYPTIAGNVSNEAQDPLVSGELTNVGVYEHAGSRGNSAQFPGPGGIRHANLEDYQVREKVSSVPVAWTGPWS